MAKTATVRTAKSIVFYAGAIALSVPQVFVFAWMVMTGLKTGVQNIAYPPEFIFTPTLENYQAVFQQHNFLRYLMNSLIIAGLATGISLLLGLPAAYSIAKYRQGKIGIMILLARMTPFVSYLLPWYIIFRYLKLIDTYTALTLTHLIITLPMVTWLMIAFFESVPADLEDAATFERVKELSELGVNVLLCGAISLTLEKALIGAGIRVVGFLGGELENVIQAFLEGSLGDGRIRNASRIETQPGMSTAKATSAAKTRKPASREHGLRR